MKTANLKDIKNGLIKPLNIVLLEEVSSTMDYVKTHSDLFAVISKTQTQGRGTKGRQFYSIEGGIYLSAQINCNVKADRLSLITPYFATVVGSALKEFNIPYSYKWVNDVFVGGKKACGILTETSISNSTLNKIVVGIGLNVNQKSFPEGLSSIATSLALEGYDVDINRLIASLLNKISSFAEDFLSYDFLCEYKENSLVLGRRVSVLSGEDKICGVAEKIGDLGELIIKTQDGYKSVFVGDLTLL